MANPGIEELKNQEHYELIATLDHKQIKEFVIEQLSNGGKLVTVYMFYQILMIVTGVFFFIHSIVLFFRDSHLPFYFSIVALLFCFSLLIIIHELLHGLALKLIGAPRIHYGGYLRKFIFYAEADKFVINRKQFQFIALTPLFIVKILCLAGIVVFFSSPIIYFFIFTMCAHSLFCAGDIGLISIFNQYKSSEVFTYDIRSEKKSYYYKSIDTEASRKELPET